MARASPEIKAAALADLMAGEQPAVVAAKYGLDQALVRVWKQRHVTVNDSQDVTPVTVRKPRQEAEQQAFGKLILDLLRTKLEASQAVAETAKDPKWRARQTAAELAVFGQWLDASAFALGDRLAGSRPATEPGTDGDA